VTSARHKYWEVDDEDGNRASTLPWVQQANVLWEEKDEGGVLVSGGNRDGSMCWTRVSPCTGTGVDIAK